MTTLTPMTNTMRRKKRPTGIQTFAKIRATDSKLNGQVDDCDDADTNNDIDNYVYYYVDKTSHIGRLVDEYSYVFLSRPRRFGKSLTIDTIAELFAGNRPLFKGLDIEDDWDWDIKYPVIRIGFAKGVLKHPDALVEELDKQLRDLETHFSLCPRSQSIHNRFDDLINHVVEKFERQAVILIDEYDKPILDNLDNPDVAKTMRDGLRDLYAVIKGQDANLKFVMLTGVSKFSKVNLFSGLNNLTDITLDKRYSDLCGYTHEELQTVFAPEFSDLDEGEREDLLDEMQTWYNGYNWGGQAVYNPFDVLQFLPNREFRPYWFETGTPTFLYDLLKEQPRYIPALSGMTTDSMQLSQFDVSAISPEALLFQTGYLTIDKVIRQFSEYHYQLKFPNLEVYQSFHGYLLQDWLPLVNRQLITDQRLKLGDLLLANDFAGMQTLFTAFFASIPNDWYRNNAIANYEGFYASVFYAYFASLGLSITCEDVTNLGRIDMTVHFNDQHYLFEFKVVEDSPQGNALMQLKARHYAEKYRATEQPIHLIGVEFSKQQRAVVGFEFETLSTYKTSS